MTKKIVSSRRNDSDRNEKRMNGRQARRGRQGAATDGPAAPAPSERRSTSTASVIGDPRLGPGAGPPHRYREGPRRTRTAGREVEDGPQKKDGKALSDERDANGGLRRTTPQ